MVTNPDAAVWRQSAAGLMIGDIAWRPRRVATAFAPAVTVTVVAAAVFAATGHLWAAGVIGLIALAATSLSAASVESPDITVIAGLAHVLDFDAREQLYDLWDELDAAEARLDEFTAAVRRADQANADQIVVAYRRNIWEAATQLDQFTGRARRVQPGPALDRDMSDVVDHVSNAVATARHLFDVAVAAAPAEIPGQSQVELVEAARWADHLELRAEARRELDRY